MCKKKRKNKKCVGQKPGTICTCLNRLLLERCFTSPHGLFHTFTPQMEMLNTFMQWKHINVLNYVHPLDDISLLKKFLKNSEYLGCFINNLCSLKVNQSIYFKMCDFRNNEFEWSLKLALSIIPDYCFFGELFFFLTLAVI